MWGELVGGSWRKYGASWLGRVGFGANRPAPVLSIQPRDTGTTFGPMPGVHPALNPVSVNKTHLHNIYTMSDQLSQ